MRTVTLAELQISISVAIRTAPKHVKRGLLDHISDKAASDMAKHILDRINIVEAIAQDLPTDYGV